MTTARGKRKRYGDYSEEEPDESDEEELPAKRSRTSNGAVAGSKETRAERAAKRQNPPKPTKSRALPARNKTKKFADYEQDSPDEEEELSDSDLESDEEGEEEGEDKCRKCSIEKNSQIYTGNAQ